MAERSQSQLAEAIARAAHAGQTDRAGRPYIEHVERVAAGVEPADAAVAWLHDVLEDTPITAGDLAAQGVDPEVIEAVEAITRHDDEHPDGYYARVRANPAALRVKASDLADNTSEARLAQLDPATRARLEAKYAHARAALGFTAPA